MGALLMVHAVERIEKVGDPLAACIGVQQHLPSVCWHRTMSRDTGRRVAPSNAEHRLELFRVL